MSEQRAILLENLDKLMYGHFDEDIRELRELLLQMGGSVEEALEEAIQNLLERNSEHASKIFTIEKKINRLHMDIDKTCMNLLARHCPVAKDLRILLAVIKINNDLERMGDEAVNIARNTRRLSEIALSNSYQSIPLMAKKVQKMVRSALNAFLNTDEESARTVLGSDPDIDEAQGKIFAQLLATMKKDPQHIPELIDLVLVSTNLERLGDHATNIAEDVIFIASGQDVRHLGKA